MRATFCAPGHGVATLFSRIVTPPARRFKKQSESCAEAFCDLRERDAAREQAIRTIPVLMREAGVAGGVAEF